MNKDIQMVVRPLKPHVIFCVQLRSNLYRFHVLWKTNHSVNQMVRSIIGSKHGPQCQVAITSDLGRQCTNRMHMQFSVLHAVVWQASSCTTMLVHYCGSSLNHGHSISYTWYLSSNSRLMTNEHFHTSNVYICSAPHRLSEMQSAVDRLWKGTAGKSCISSPPVLTPLSPQNLEKYRFINNTHTYLSLGYFSHS